MGKISGKKSDRNDVQGRRENETDSPLVVCLRSPQKHEFGYFTLLFEEDSKEIYENKTYNARAERLLLLVKPIVL